MGINEHGIFIPHNIRLLSTYCFELISTGGSVPSLTNTSVFPINYQILLLDSYLVTVKVTFRCTAMLVFKLQREILGRFLLNKLQISLFVFVFFNWCAFPSCCDLFSSVFLVDHSSTLEWYIKHFKDCMNLCFFMTSTDLYLYEKNATIITVQV